MSSWEAVYNLSNKNSLVGWDSSSFSADATIALSCCSMFIFSAALMQLVSWQKTLTLLKAITIYSCHLPSPGIGRGAAFYCSCIWKNSWGSVKNEVSNLNNLSTSETVHRLLRQRRTRRWSNKVLLPSRILAFCPCPYPNLLHRIYLNKLCSDQHLSVYCSMRMKASYNEWSHHFSTRLLARAS